MDKLLSIRNLKLRLAIGRQIITAIDGLDLDVFDGEILALVGESGSGKTMTALSLTKILPDSALSLEGKILFKGADLLEYSEKDLRGVRGKEISYIFQEATASLNPVLAIGRQMIETIMLHQNKSRSDSLETALELIRMVRLPRPEDILRSYPHQLSGGMNQRVMIAMALATSPRLLIADEPTTALDVTIEKEIIQVLLELKAKFGFSVLFITHNLSLVRRFADRIAIMYKGKIVEQGAVEDIFNRPRAAHTQELIRAII